jgi:hypothetical protein
MDVSARYPPSRSPATTRSIGLELFVTAQVSPKALPGTPPAGAVTSGQAARPLERAIRADLWA